MAKDPVLEFKDIDLLHTLMFIWCKINLEIAIAKEIKLEQNIANDIFFIIILESTGQNLF